MVAAENPRLAAAWRNVRRRFPDLSPGHLSHPAAALAVEAGRGSHQVLDVARAELGLDGIVQQDRHGQPLDLTGAGRGNLRAQRSADAGEHGDASGEDRARLDVRRRVSLARRGAQQPRRPHLRERHRAARWRLHGHRRVWIDIAAEWGRRDYWPFVERVRCPMLAIEAEHSAMPPGLAVMTNGISQP